MKTFTVTYITTVCHEAVVLAYDEEEARQIVLDGEHEDCRQEIIDQWIDEVEESSQSDQR